MFWYLARRLFAAVPVMLFVTVFVFLLLRLTPGDPAAVIAGDTATPEQLEHIRAALGLLQPIHQQFLGWAGHLMRGDLGVSLLSNKAVTTLIGQRLEPTISLALLTLIITVAVSIPMGVLAAWRHGTWFDKFVMSISVLGFSVPVFVVGYVLVSIFSMSLGLLPTQGFVSISKGIRPFLERAILPALTLSSIYVALIARMTRAALLDVLGEDYIRTARAKGLKEVTVLFRHALRNASAPILTVIGAGFALMISGVVVTESVFNIPGLGRLTVDAILARDYPVIQGLILLTAGAYVLINLLIDLSYALLDPRIRY